MRLSELLSASGLSGALVVTPPGAPDPEVRVVTRDSREAASDAVFVAVRGARVDGHTLAPGLDVAAVVVEREVVVRPGVVVIRVGDARAALAALAAGLHGHPGAQVPVVAVTGTNGKSTVVALIAAAAAHPAVGWRSGRIGTLGASWSGGGAATQLTTPEAPDLQALLARMRADGVGVVALEASSIGLEQRRLDGIPFHAAVFTNLSRDHLDHHGSMAAYAAAKARLFEELLRPAGGLPRALLWGDDPSWPLMTPPADRWLFGVGPGADVRISDQRLDRDRSSFRVDSPCGGGRVETGLIGAHNVRNVACALAALVLCGVPVEAAAEALAASVPVDGRLETVPNDRGLLIVVDYAHSPDALGVALEALRPLTHGALWVVFGCGGDRDRGKRPEMGAIAERLADRVVVTSDNPRSEPPQAILDDILGGLRAAPFAVDEDRGAAIARAVHAAEPGDTVLIAGKGHERYQEVAGHKRPFDDRDAVRRALGGP